MSSYTLIFFTDGKILYTKPNPVATWALTMSSIRASSSSLFSRLFSLSSFWAWERDFTSWGDPGGPRTTPLCSWSLWTSWEWCLVWSVALCLLWGLLREPLCWNLWLLSVPESGLEASVYWELASSSRRANRGSVREDRCKKVWSLNKHPGKIQWKLRPHSAE